MKDVAYGCHSRQCLDIYRPVGVGPFPVVVFIHGGGWHESTKDDYSHIGNWLRSHNIIGVLINYRLSPSVVHPVHAQDCAQSLAWVYKNIHSYGGDRSRLYLTGFSAGGHLAALMATNPSYLKAHSLSVDIIKGMVTMSGVYQITFLLDLFGYGGAFPWASRREASPLYHVKKGLPPWIVIYATNDFSTLGGQAKKFYETLIKNGVKAKLVVIDSDHPSLTENLLKSSEEASRLVEFFRQP